MTAHPSPPEPPSWPAGQPPVQPAGQAAGQPASAEWAGAAPQAAVPLALVLTLALQSAVPPFATDTYTTAFPQVMAELHTSSALVGMTLTTFFIGLALGQLVGGPVSDQWGRRRPLVLGGALCTLGAIGCALAPSIWVLLVARIVQGLGGGVAAAVARSVLVDVAHGDQLARVMSLMMAMGGLAPMVAPVLGGAVLTLGGTWRTVFWVLVVFGLALAATALAFVPESLPPGRRHAGGLGQLLGGFAAVLRNPVFDGYAIASALSGFTMMGYIANASYVLRGMKGMHPMTFSLFFAATAFCQVLLSLVCARVVGRIRPRTLVAAGLAGSVAAVVVLMVAVWALHVSLVLTCAGFLVLMAVQAPVQGNAGALAAQAAPQQVGAASAVFGVLQAAALAVSAPLATSGGTRSASPMMWVMIVGVIGAVLAFLTLTRPRETSR